MFMPLRGILTITFLAIAHWALAQEAVDTRSRDVVIQSVNVIPMDQERVLTNQTVVIRKGTIVQMGDAKKIKPNKNSLIVDGKGKYLIPGISEMHAHVPPSEDIVAMKETLLLFACNGVTTIRGMLGHAKHLELRAMVQKAEIIAPHFYTTGPSFSGLSVTSPEAGMEMVRKQKQAGYDYLKFHPGLSKAKFDAIARTANELKMPFAGHVSFGVGIWRAIDAGYSTIDHLDGFVEALVPGIDTMVEQQTGLFSMYIANRADVSGIPKLVQALHDKNIWVVPTQALAERWLGPADQETFLSSAEMKYMKREILEGWARSRKNITENQQFNKGNAEQFVALRRQLILACQKAKVGLLLGSDAPQVFNVPGFASHHELKYLVDSGLTPYEALQTGTVNVARYLNRPKSGTIAVGNDADLILLHDNPLVNIENTKKIESVMVGPYFLSRSFLNASLKALEKN